MDKYSEYIMKLLRQHRGLNPDDESEDDDIMAMSPNEAFASLLEWEGIIGYDHTIRSYIEEVYKVTLG